MSTLDARLKAIVGARGWKSDPEDLKPHLQDWRGVYEGDTRLLVAPDTTEQVSQVVAACAEAGVGIVAQGGNTGLCGGALPNRDEVLLSLARLNRIRKVDALNDTIDVDAGCILADVQQAARNAGRYFPLSLGAEGSCQIGGNLSTNAGGINVIRYGTARSQVLGLEVVLADGTVLDSMRSLRKDTAGYDLKQLFIGSEGTLGIITGASLRLVPDPGETATALVAIGDSGDAVHLLGALRAEVGDCIEAFELMSRRIFETVEQHLPDAKLPLDEPYPWYVLTDVATDADRLASALQTAAEAHLVLDAVIAKNASESGRLWQMRHSVGEAERRLGRALKHDLSVPLSRMQEFLTRGETLVTEMQPEATLLAFGHVGDGNLHYNVRLPAGPDSEEGRQLTGAIYDLVDELGGSFSAEHGIGIAKKASLQRYRGVEYELMRRLKQALDPRGILNPGKVI